MKCSICKNEIEKKYMTNIDGEKVMYWDNGHNAQPINDGRCCDKCNATVVMAARFENAGLSNAMSLAMVLKEMTEKLEESE